MLRKTLAAGLALAFGLVAVPASAATWWTATPSITIGSASVNVRNTGAKGDGVHNDTAAIQAAINSLPSSGGTIVVPAGRYMIDASRSINLRSHTRLSLDSSAQLVAIPNNLTRSYVVKARRVNNVEIRGGAIIGERVRHVGTSGEWGMGVDIMGSSKVYVHDLKVSDCWGDGIYVGAIGKGSTLVPSTDVTINRVTSNNNRRQGLSFGPVQRVYVVNSAFTNTNGTAPQAGIDIEPANQGPAKYIRIEATKLTGNRGNGLEIHDHVSGLVVNSTTMKGNNGFGALSVGGISSSISSSLITENGLDGVAMTTTSNGWQIIGNTITYNSTRWFIAHNKSIYTLTSSERDIQISSTARNITLKSNKLSPTHDPREVVCASATLACFSHAPNAPNAPGSRLHRHRSSDLCGSPGWPADDACRTPHIGIERRLRGSSDDLPSAGDDGPVYYRFQCLKFIYINKIRIFNSVHLCTFRDGSVEAR